MLGGHPRLFAPPELELLSFKTMAERRAAFPGRDSFWLEGAVRAVIEARGCDAEEAAGSSRPASARAGRRASFYRQLQEWIGGRMLVDKTPSYALDPGGAEAGRRGLRRSRCYIHLVRHPHGMIASFEEARLDQIFFRRAHRSRAASWPS